MIYEFWKTKLSAAERQFYNNLYSAVSSGKSSVGVRGLDAESIKRTYLFFKCDHPELFYLTNMPMLATSGFSEYSLTVQSVYPYPERQKRAKALSDAVTEISGKLLRGADEFEKELAVAEYLVDRVQYSIDNVYNQDASSVIYAGRAQCSGIAAAVKYIFDNIGIKCITVSGEAKVANRNNAHLWNIVYIGGKPYHLDVTSIIGSNCRGNRPYVYNFFNLSDKQISATHRWDKSSVPGCAFPFLPPKPAQRLQDAIIMPAGEAYENGDNSVIIRSLYEFRRRFSDEVNKQHGEFAFKSDIKCDDDNELMKILSQACRQCMEQKKIKRSVSITISSGVVILGW